MGLDERALAGLARRIHSGDLVGAVAFDAVVAMIAADEIPRDCLPGQAAQIRDEIVLGLSHDQELCKLLYQAPEQSARTTRRAKPVIAARGPLAPSRPGAAESTRDDEDLPQVPAMPARPTKQKKAKKPARPKPVKAKKTKEKPRERASELEDEDYAGARRRSQLLGGLGFVAVIGAGVAFWHFTKTSPCEALVKQLCLEGSTVTCKTKQFEDALRSKGVDDAKCTATSEAIEEATQGVGNVARGRVLAGTLQTELGFDPRGDAGPPPRQPIAEKGPAKPMPLVTGQGAITSMVVDESHLYWTRSNPAAAVRVRNIGGTPEVLGAHVDPIDIKASRDYVYWLSRVPEQSTVWVDPKRGAHEPSTLPTPEFQPTRAAFIGAEYGFLDATGAVAVAAVSGGAPRKLVEPMVPAPVSIAGDRTMIYFGVPAPTSAIHAVPRDGSAGPKVIVAGVANPLVLKTHARHIYWIDAATGTIARVPAEGGDATVLAAGQTGAGALAFDAKHVYWTDAGLGTVSSVPMSGGEVTPVASGYVGVTNVAVDGAAIYWDNGGTIYRLPK